MTSPLVLDMSRVYAKVAEAAKATGQPVPNEWVVAITDAILAEMKAQYLEARR